MWPVGSQGMEMGARIKEGEGKKVGGGELCCPLDMAAQREAATGNLL